MNKSSPNIVERTEDWTFMSEMIRFFGIASTARIIGWCILVGATLREGESTVQCVDRLVERGFSRASAYRVVDEIRDFKTHLEGVESKRLNKEVHIKIEDMLSNIRREALS